MANPETIRPVQRGRELEWFNVALSYSYRFYLDSDGNLWGTTDEGGLVGATPDPRNPSSPTRYRLATGVISFLIANWLIEGGSAMVILREDGYPDHNYDLSVNGSPNTTDFKSKTDAISDYYVITSGSSATLFARRRPGSSSRFDADWTDVEVTPPTGLATFIKTVHP